MLFGALALRFFQPQGRGTKALFSQTLRRKALASRRLFALSVLQQLHVFKFFLRSFT
jgi:hypothetical protein